MNNQQRTDIYLRDRSSVTPAQRRRIRKHAGRDARPTQVNRVGRIRRAFERSEARRLRREGASLVAAIRAGYFRRGGAK